MKLKKTILNGEGVVLRPYVLKDAQQFSKLGESNWRIGKINTLKKAKKWIKKSWVENSCYFGVFLKEDNKLIGNVELCHMNWWQNKAGEICYMIKKEYRGKGYAKEASKILINHCFKKLRFHKIYADTDHDNIISQKVLEKLGFRFEGRIREKHLVNGRWKDEMDYGLLRKEWKK